MYTLSIAYNIHPRLLREQILAAANNDEEVESDSQVEQFSSESSSGESSEAEEEMDVDTEAPTEN